MTTKSKISNWYLKGQYVPQLGTVSFARFAAHGFSLISEISNSPTAIEYRVDPLAKCASFDQMRKVLALPGWYFSKDGVEVYAKSGNDNMNALSLINGSTIHEALHSKYTTQNFGDAIISVTELVKHPVSQKLVASIVNIVEDVYIENLRSLKEHQVAWLASKNDILFNDELFADALSKMDPTDIASMTNVLLFFKRQSLQSEVAEVVGPEIAKLFEELRGHTLSVDQRNFVAARIILALLSEVEKATESKKSESSEFTKSESGEGESESTETGDEENEEPESSETGDEENEESESSETGDEENEESESSEESEPTEEESEESESSEEPSEPEEFDAGNEPDDVEGARGDEGKEIEKIAKKEETKLAKLAGAFRQMVALEANGIDEKKELRKHDHELDRLTKGLKIVDVSAISLGHNSLPKIDLANRFVAQLKQMRTVLPTRGRGKLSGGRIDVLRLHQVAIDGKVFSQKSIEQTGNNDKVEIIILVDASGSMNHTDIAKFEGTLYTHSIAVAHKVFMALVSSNIQTKVMAHTSHYDDMPLLIKIADSATKNFDKKFEQALSISLVQNLDGVIIDEIVKNQFVSDSRTQKILLVLSDGVPQSPNYDRGFGISHTKSVVKNAREKGIKVFSVSLIGRVVEHNNEIYGANYNVDASNNLDSGLVDLVTRLVRRK